VIRNGRGVLRLVAAILCCALAAQACGGKAPTRPGPSISETPGETVTAAAATAIPSPSPTVAPPAEAPRLLREGRFEEAAAAFTALASAAGDPSSRAGALLGLAVARHESGERQAALDALQDALATAPAGSAEHTRAAYLLGLRLNEAGRAEDAELALRAAASTPSASPLSPYVRLEFARALSLSGKGGEAERAWDALTASSSPDDVRGIALRARANIARDRADTAAHLAALRELTAFTGDAADRFELARLSAARGDDATAATNYRAIVYNTPASRFAPAAVEALDELGEPADPGQVGYVYYRHRALAEAERVLAPLVASYEGATGPAAAFATYYLAATLEDAGRLREAVELYDRAATLDSGPYRHRSLYWAARTTETLGDLEDASRRYASLAANGPRGEFSAEAGFRAGYTLYRDEDPAAAVRAWDVEGVSIDARTFYWKGRALELAGEAAAAIAAYREAYDRGPVDFYGMAAGERLGLRGPLDTGYRTRTLQPQPEWDAIVTWLSGHAPNSAPRLDPSRVHEFVAVGLLDRASAAALALAPEGADVWTVYEAMKVSSEAGLPDAAARLAIRLVRAVGTTTIDAPVGVLRQAYPLAFVALLDKEARANNIDPLFMAALIRQESFWDAKAQSPADAFGLTQVIPATGEAIAAELGFGGFDVGDLLHPRVSLRFGAYYIANQLRQFGSPQAALAAYNAGPGNAGRWSANARGATAADFVEAIDILETHDYVIFVLEHLAHYEAAYGPG
jgi:soluble lytic murein transglycosylase